MAKRLHDEDHKNQELKRPKTQNVKLLGRLGSGVYGTVYAVEADRGAPMAMKVLRNLSTEKISDYEDLVREAYGLSASGLLEGLGVTSFGDRAALFMPGYGRRMQCVVPTVCPPEHLAYLIRPVAEQLAAMPGMHRDVKPQNIVMNADGQGVIVDFSLATNLPVSKDSNVVTLWYRAPEIIVGTVYSKTVDIWSLGITMLHMLMGSLFTRVCKEADVVHFLLDVLDHFGWPADWPELYTYLDKRIHVGLRRGQRGILLPYLRHIFADRFQSSSSEAALCDATDLITRMCAVRPADRIVWSEVLTHPFWSHAESLKNPYSAPSISIVPEGLDFLDQLRIFWTTKSEPLVGPLPDEPDKTLIVHMDYVLQYAMMMKFSIDTAVRAFQIHQYALAGGIRPSIASLCASLFLASAYNEDVRCREDMSWAKWGDIWCIYKSDQMEIVKATVLKVLCATRARWPSWGLKEVEDFVDSVADETPHEFEPWMTSFMVCYGDPSTFSIHGMKTLGTCLNSMLKDIVCHPESGFDETGSPRP
jgi:serine/threonine protein kinase